MMNEHLELINASKALTDFPAGGYLQVNYCGHKMDYAVGHTIILPKGRKDYCLFYVESGWFNITSGQQTRRIDARRCVLFRPGVQQYISFPLGSKAVFYCAYFTGLAIEEIVEPLHLSDITICAIDDHTMFEMLFHQLWQCYLSFKVFNGRKSISSLRANSLMLQLVDLFSNSLVNKDKPDQGNIMPAAVYISEHFREEIDMQQLAALSHLSLSRFSHAFTEKVGVSPYKFAISLRMDEAKELLVYSSMSIKEIAQSVGYADSSYFCRLFHKYTGHTPSDYRK